MKRLIVTADDFGHSIAVNDAVVEAHLNGILTGASLMVAGAAAADAVERAASLPGLRVGLHVVLVDGKPLSPPCQIPDLVDESGQFSSQLVRTGVRLTSRRVRAQLEAETAAQFAAFVASGLELDHVNAHHHMHLHPVVARILLEVGEKFGLEAIRIPDEPVLQALCNTRSEQLKRAMKRRFLSPWNRRLRRLCAGYGVLSNDVMFGLYDSGSLTVEKLVRILAHTPSGVTEIMTHPAKQTDASVKRSEHAPGHEEYLALMHPRVHRAVERFGLELGGFGEPRPR